MADLEPVAPVQVEGLQATLCHCAIMLDTLLALINYTITLFEHRERYDRTFYEVILQPTYKLSENVVKNYLQLFTAVEHLAKRRVRREAIIEFLERGRVEHLTARVELHMILARHHVWAEPDYDPFVKALGDVLGGALSIYEQTHLVARFGQKRHTLLDVLYAVQRFPDKHFHSQFLEVVAEQRAFLEEAWTNLTACFIDVQMRVGRGRN